MRSLKILFLAIVPLIVAFDFPESSGSGRVNSFLSEANGYDYKTSQQLYDLIVPAEIASAYSASVQPAKVGDCMDFLWYDTGSTTSFGGTESRVWKATRVIGAELASLTNPGSYFMHAAATNHSALAILDPPLYSDIAADWPYANPAMTSSNQQEIFAGFRFSETESLTAFGAGFANLAIIPDGTVASAWSVANQQLEPTNGVVIEVNDNSSGTIVTSLKVWQAGTLEVDETISEIAANGTVFTVAVEMLNVSGDATEDRVRVWVNRSLVADKTGDAGGLVATGVDFRPAMHVGSASAGIAPGIRLTTSGVCWAYAY